MPATEASTILLVEDETLVRMHGMDILEDAGFEVIEAGDADEALGILAQHDRVHLLFSDIAMPGSMDGLDLARVVHERWPHIRLLLTSSHHRLEASDVPAGGKFTAKPWAAEALIEKIHRLLAA